MRLACMRVCAHKHLPKSLSNYPIRPLEACSPQGFHWSLQAEKSFATEMIPDKRKTQWRRQTRVVTFSAILGKHWEVMSLFSLSKYAKEIPHILRGLNYLCYLENTSKTSNLFYRKRFQANAHELLENFLSKSHCGRKAFSHTDVP